MPIPADSGPGYTVKFLFHGHWVPITSVLQPTKAQNLRMCYRVLTYIDEMERRGITGVVQQTMSEMGLVSTSQRDNMAEESQILGVRVDAKPDEVKSAYREKVKRYHPDNQDTGDGDIFKAIQRAYERLMAHLGEKV